MTMYKEKNLDPIVQRVETISGMHYSQCKAVVTLDISDGKGGRKDLTVVYPLQGDTHMVMLMKDSETRKDINHDEKFPIASAILDKIERN